MWDSQRRLCLALYAAKTIHLFRTSSRELYVACTLSRDMIQRVHFTELSKESG